MRKDLLISVIMPTFNSSASIKSSLKSLADQECRNFELIICDGASSDSTVSIANHFAAQIPNVTILSSRDSGIYDAINKGIDMAKGRWIIVLGSDDSLHSSSTLLRASMVLQHTDAAAVYGDVRVIGENAMVASGGRYGGVFTLGRLLGENVCQQAVFYRRTIFERLGKFSLAYPIWADWEFSQKLFASERTQWIDLVITDYSAGGKSSRAADTEFLRTQTQRLWTIWRKRPLSSVVITALLRQLYWKVSRGLRRVRSQHHES